MESICMSADAVPAMARREAYLRRHDRIVYGEALQIWARDISSLACHFSFPPDVDISRRYSLSILWFSIRPTRTARTLSHGAKYIRETLTWRLPWLARNQKSIQPILTPKSVD